MKKINLSSIAFYLLAIVAIALFYYFEESLLLKNLVILFIFVVIGSILFSQKKESLFKKSELAILLIIYLFSLNCFYLIYYLNFPLAVAMVILIIAVIILINYAFFKTYELLSNYDYWLLTLIVTLILLESFLSLYFWPLSPEIKSLIMTIIFYLLSNIIYLYANNMLNLNKTRNYILICFFIIIFIMLLSWLKIGGQAI